MELLILHLKNQLFTATRFRGNATAINAARNCAQGAVDYAKLMAAERGDRAIIIAIDKLWYGEYRDLFNELVKEAS